MMSSWPLNVVVRKRSHMGVGLGWGVQSVVLEWRWTGSEGVSSPVLRLMMPPGVLSSVGRWSNSVCVMVILGEGVGVGWELAEDSFGEFADDAAACGLGLPRGACPPCPLLPVGDVAEVVKVGVDEEEGVCIFCEVA